MPTASTAALPGRRASSGSSYWELSSAPRYSLTFALPLLLAYEAAPAFDAALRVQPTAGPVPLAWAATYRAPSPACPIAEAAVSPASVAWEPVIDETRFARDIARVREFRERHGDIVLKPLHGRTLLFLSFVFSSSSNCCSACSKT